MKKMKIVSVCLSLLLIVTGFVMPYSVLAGDVPQPEEDTFTMETLTLDEFTSFEELPGEEYVENGTPEVSDEGDGDTGNAEVSPADGETNDGGTNNGDSSGLNEENNSDSSGDTTDTVPVYIGKRVTGIKLNKTTVTLRTGSSYTLKTTIRPSNAANKTLIWHSSDIDVASVSDSGVVTANAQGIAVITVTTQDGNKTAICTITVKPPVDGLTLKPSPDTMRKGSAYRLIADISPDNAFDKRVTWMSSDKKVATVDKKGKVRARAPGTAVSTCTSRDNSDCSASFTITVKPKVRKIILSATSSSLAVLPDKSFELNATVVPDDAYNTDVKWKSSKPYVATIDEDGLVTSIAAGKTVITCTSADNSKIKKKVTVNVKLPVAGLKLNVASKNIIEGNTYTLKATVSPSNAIDKRVTWTSSDTSVATVSTSGKVKARNVGVATITCTSNFDPGFTAEAIINVTPPLSVSNARRGIDVSNYQGNIDWAAVKAGGKVDFVIVRALAWDSAADNYKVDDSFVRNVRGAQAQGIRVGAYIYCYSTTVAHFNAGVDLMHKTAKDNGLSFQLPVFIDFEWSGNLTRNTYAERTNLVEQGMIKIEKCGYIPGFYSNLNWARNYYDAQALEKKGYAFWLANYKSPNTPDRSPSEPHGWHKLPTFWQYTSVGSVPGIKGNVDMNFCYSTAYFK